MGGAAAFPPIPAGGAWLESLRCQPVDKFRYRLSVAHGLPPFSIHWRIVSGRHRGMRPRLTSGRGSFPADLSLSTARRLTLRTRVKSAIESSGSSVGLGAL